MNLVPDPEQEFTAVMKGVSDSIHQVNVGSNPTVPIGSEAWLRHADGKSEHEARTTQ